MKFILGAAVYAPQEFTVKERAFSLLTAALVFVWNDVFTLVMILAASATLGDYWIGRRIAKAHKEYDSLKAELGFVGKMAGFLILLLIRGLEVALSRAQVGEIPLDTSGYVATAFAIGYLGKQIESINAHRASVDGLKWPLLDKFIEKMGSLVELLFNGKGKTENGTDDQS